MKPSIMISGFADEISSDFETQLETVTALGMHYISLRSADGTGIADYTADEVTAKLLPKLKHFGVSVSSLGSPIGKIDAADEDGFERQQKQLEILCEICKVLDCRYIRMFSFYISEGRKPEDCRDIILRKLARFLDIAKVHDVVLIHENEKDIYGDTKERCLDLMESLSDSHFRFAFDFANFVQCGEDTNECWNLLHPYVSYIHIKDAVAAEQENVVCGTGEGNIREILTRAIHKDGYEGFLTLEPHLVLFDSLASLETKSPDSIIRENKASDGAKGYQMQYQALATILNTI